MTAQPSSLHHSLPHYEPARAALQTAAVALFNGGEAGGLRLTARLADDAERRRATGWIRFDADDTHVAVAPLIADGLLASIAGEDGRPDGVIAAALLGRIEPLIAALETMLERPLMPSGLADAVALDWVTLRLDGLLPGGAVHHGLLLALPEGITLDRAPPVVPALVRRMRIDWRATLDGPRIARRRLAAVARGDLLLLGLGPYPARLSLPGHRAPVAARIDLARREALLLSETELETRMTSTWDDMIAAEPMTEEGAAAPSLAALPVPVRIEFDGGSIAAGTLAGLTEGSILPLAATGDTLPVRLLAGDMLWADGALVAVGDGYGVLIEAIRAEAS